LTLVVRCDKMSAMTTPTVDERVERYKNVTDLKKFDMKYRVINDGTDGSEMVERIWEWCIPGKHGQVYPVGFNGDLGVLSEKPRIASKLRALGLQRLQGEVAFRFPPARIHEVAEIILARKSRKGKFIMTPEQRAAAIERLKLARKSRRNSIGSPNSKAAVDGSRALSAV